MSDGSGPQLKPVPFAAGMLIGAVVGITLVVMRGRDHRIPIPFGPYLAAAGFVALLWGEHINRAYLQIAGLS